jgi:hypothetical protein
MTKSITKLNHFLVLIIVISGSVLGSLSAQTTYTFTNASATGSVGPTQGQVNTAYAATNLNGMVTTTTNGIQTWTVPSTGVYKIDARGAQGGIGNSVPGGLGAKMIGDFNLTAGEVIWILVGQVGDNGGTGPGGGSGGSFVVRTPYTTTASILVIAGGGSGNGNYSFTSGVSTTSGVAGGAPGGTNGNGGSGGSRGAGGGGFLTSGSPCTVNVNYANPGQAFINGGAGGAATNNCAFSASGGFGGGSSHGGNCINNGGAGGGYSGGGGSSNTTSGAGGSFNSGTNQINTSASNTGNGLVIITQMYAAAISQSSIIACNGNSTAVLSATINGGQAPYTYAWLPAGGNGSITTALGAGVYTLNVTDNLNQVTSSTYTINQPSILSGSVSAQINATCFGNANGSATINANGGTAPYTYTWSPSGGNTLTATGLSPGAYTCSIGDNNNCPISNITLTITSPAAISGTTSSTSVCQGNTVSLTGTGATSYTWSGGVVNGAAFTPTSSASYTVSGTNSVTSCSGTSVISITVNPTPTISVAGSTICSGSSATLLPSGAATYTFSSGSAIVSPTTTTAYTVSGTSAAGCVANSVSVSVIVTTCTGLENNLPENLSLKIYPNPNNGQFTVDGGNLELKWIEIKDVTGKTIVSKSMKNSKTEISLLDYANGIYLIKINTDNGNQTLKIIKE